MDEKYNDKQGDLIAEWEVNRSLDVFKFHLSSMLPNLACERMVDDFDKWKLTAPDFLGFADIVLGYVQAVQDGNRLQVKVYSTKGFDKDKPVFSEQGEELPLPIEQIAEDLKQALETEASRIEPGHSRVGARPKPHYEWAYQQIKGGRDQAEVYSEWLGKIPREDKDRLVDPLDSFKKAMRYREKKEKRE